MLAFAVNHYELFLLVLLRMLGFIGASPLLSVQSWPTTAKLGLGLYVALTVAPTVAVSGTIPSITTDPGSFLILAVQESMTGLVLGFLATILFSAVSMAGQMFDIQAGFGSAVLYNPLESQAIGLSSNISNLLFSLYFLGVNGMDGLLMAVMNSYQAIPLGQFHWPVHFWVFLVQSLGLAMTLAVQMIAPLLVALLLTDVTFALLSRAVPQMNVFVVGLPAKLFVGLAMFAISMPGIVYLFGDIFTLVFQQMNNLLQLMKG